METLYLDANQNQVYNLISDMHSNAWDKADLQFIEALKPSFALDGNQYCFTYGELPNDCVQGFGDTPIKAMIDFVQNFRTQTINLLKKH